MTWDHLHDEDVLFEFTGSSAAELTEGRFYQGTVDGFAEFGVFINIGEHVTGLLHRSKLDRRLESLEWDIGDTVIVQVSTIKDNGDIDLDWSIRQTPREFRGSGVDGPEADESEEEEADVEEEEPPAPVTTEVAEPGPVEEPTGRSVLAVSRVESSTLEEHISSRVRVEGRIIEIRQTSGPTIFTIADEGGSVDCAAFESAGVRAYPTLDEEDIVRLVGVVEQHRGEIQVEVDSIEVLEGEETKTVEDRLTSAARERAAPNDTELVVADETLEEVHSQLVTLATCIREAVFSGKRILLRHPASVDGVLAAAAIERAVRAVHTEENVGTDDPGRWVERRPMDEPWYDLGDAMYDQGAIRDGQDPLIVVIGAGSSTQDEAALSFLNLYDIETAVIDSYSTDTAIDTGTQSINVPTAESTTVVASAIASMVSQSVATDVTSLPAISTRGDIDEPYIEATGVAMQTIQERHETIALIAYYQRYDDKRELVDDILFNGAATDLAEHISAQYRTKVSNAVSIAQYNCDRVSTVSRTVCSVYADDFSHRFDFPPYDVLASELYAVELADESADIVVVFGADTCYLAGISQENLPGLAHAVSEKTTDASVDFVRDRLTFLGGKREDVKSALVDELSANHNASVQ